MFIADSQIQVGSLAPSPSIVALFSESSPTTTTPLSSRGIESAVTSMRVAGANPLTNYGVVSNASGGDVNYSWFSTSGTMSNAGLADFGVVTATDVSSGTIEASGEIHSTSVGLGLAVDSNASFGTGTSNTLALNSTVTTPVLLMANASDNTILRLAQTGAGGNTWSFGSGDLAAATSAGLSIVNNTFGWETIDHRFRKAPQRVRQPRSTSEILDGCERLGVNWIGMV